MTEDALAARVDALERAVTADDDGTASPAAVDADGEDRLAELESRVAELEAATQALRGYVGNVREVERSVEERADAAVAATDRLADRVAALEGDGEARAAERRGSNGDGEGQRPDGGAGEGRPNGGSGSESEAAASHAAASAEPDQPEDETGQATPAPAADGAGATREPAWLDDPSGRLDRAAAAARGRDEPIASDGEPTTAGDPTTEAAPETDGERASLVARLREHL
jgi:hypothetical protein